jgi:phosphohistidine phosphatase SixA
MLNNVVSYETARRLKDTGFKQLASMAWVENEAEVFLTNWEQALHSRHLQMWAAPTAQEIADQLPHETKDGWLYIFPSNGIGWYASYRGPKDQGNHGPTMAEALAALYLKLKETK